MTLPEDFIKQTEAAMGGELWHTMAQGLAGDAPVSIRLNPLKCGATGCGAAGYDGRVPWCDRGIYLKSRPPFTFDPMLHAGLYYVQEASSMFLDLIMRRYVSHDAVTMLDLCAAPGGKSTVARAALHEGSLLVCNEPVRNRAQILAENIQKFGHEDVIVTNNMPHDFRRSGLTFDVILADVPCSGEGMFRKDKAATDEWSLQNVEKCQRLQREIITDIWPCLKPGGLLIYSTCTFNLKENEENVRFISEEMGAQLLEVGTDSSWNITGSLLRGFNEPVYRFIPGLTRGEGLFIAVMRKDGDCMHADTEHHAKKNRKNRTGGTKGTVVKPDTEWLRQPDKFDTVRNNDTFIAIPKTWKSVCDTACKHLKVLSAGVTLGEIKGKDIIPSQSLALSTAINTAAFNVSELDYTQAICYLRKETVTLPPDTPRGYVLVKHKGVPLGFVKNIGNRANNLYPAEWKIKSTHVPEAFSGIIGMNQ